MLYQQSSCFSRRSGSSNRERGVSAMELLLALAILGVLILIAYSTLSGSKYDARLQVSLKNVRWFNDLLTNNFRQQEGRYPDNFDEIFTLRGTIKIGKEADRKVSISADTLPFEKVSSEDGSHTYKTFDSITDLDGTGGWAYLRDEKRICINWTEPLDLSDWPLENANLSENPSEWK